MKALLIVACLSVLAGCTRTPQQRDVTYRQQKACIDAGMIAYLDRGFTSDTVECEPDAHTLTK